MSKAERFIVLPFEKLRGQTIPGEMRPASNAEAAARTASRMAERHLGVAAYAVMVDLESGDMSEPRLLCKFGEVADLATAI
ncbi:hypothetical protein OIV19_06965 [Brucella sp. HL-2]|nr:hypothetical protein [Brucella sp. HL-2]MCV9907355.1 hypothetical protein [Brucella sp. HL-2]